MVIQLENAKKNYGSFELNCSMKLEPGCVTGLIGRNGAGKSTAFKLILGLIRADGGEITIDDKNAADLDSDTKRKLGVVLAESGFSGYLKIKDVAKILKAAYPSFKEDDFMSQCEKQGLPKDKQIKEFSTGMKAKLKILAALSHDAEVLILDEPTSGLDVIAREEILDMLREYMKKEDNSILISSHIASDLEGLCDDVYMIENGQILLHEETGVILDEYGVLKVTAEQYAKLEKEYLLCAKEESYGYACLTAQKTFYQENYPDITIEKAGIDQVITLMISANGKKEA